jgi:toxin ParE1/3/4
MAKLRFTSDALENLTDIAVYIGQHTESRRLAELFTGQLRNNCKRLAGLPGTMGRTRPELGEGIRSSAYKSYVIFFRYVGDTLEVINVLEGHRDFEAYFSAEGE